jgi:hypothetical protein
MRLNLDDCLARTLNSVASDAGVSLEEALQAAVLRFVDDHDVRDEFQANPRSLRFRIPTEVEEDALIKAHGGLCGWTSTAEGLRKSDDVLRRVAFEAASR